MINTNTGNNVVYIEKLELRKDLNMVSKKEVDKIIGFVRSLNLQEKEMLLKYVGDLKQKNK